MSLAFQNFVSDFSAIVTDPTAFNNGDKRNLVNSVICEHFLRQGMLDTAEDLIQVCEMFNRVARKRGIHACHHPGLSLVQMNRIVQIDPAVPVRLHSF